MTQELTTLAIILTTLILLLISRIILVRKLQDEAYEDLVCLNRVNYPPPKRNGFSG